MTYPWIFYFGLCCIIILTNLEVTMVNTALPSIIYDLDLNLTDAQAILGCYLLGALIAFLLCGRLSSYMSPINVYRWGIIIFFLGTLICSVSSNPVLLTLGRFIQGTGFAASFSMSLVLLRTCFLQKQLSLVIGCTTMISGFTQAIGPVLSAWILDITSWKYIFLLKLPVTAAAYGLSYLHTTTNPSVCMKKFDRWGALLWVGGVISFYFGLEANLLILKLPLLLFSIFIGRAIYQHSKRSEAPFFPIELLKNFSFRTSILSRMLAMFYFSSLFFLLPLYLQNILGYSPLEIGTALLWMTISYASGSLSFGILEKYYSVRLHFAPIMLCLSACLLVTDLIFPSSIQFYSGLAFAGMSFGIFMPQSMALSLKDIQYENHGIGMGLFCSLGFFGSLLGVSISSLILQLMSHLVCRDPNAILGAQGLQPLSILNPLSQVEAQYAFISAYGLIMGLSALLSIFWILQINKDKKLFA